MLFYRVVNVLLLVEKKNLAKCLWWTFLLLLLLLLLIFVTLPLQNLQNGKKHFLLKKGQFRIYYLWIIFLSLKVFFPYICINIVKNIKYKITIYHLFILDNMICFIIILMFWINYIYFASSMHSKLNKSWNKYIYEPNILKVG